MENRMCSLIFFASFGKSICDLVPFLVLLENLMCSRNLFKKVVPGKKEQKNSSPAASVKALPRIRGFLTQYQTDRLNNPFVLSPIKMSSGVDVLLQ